MLEGNSRMALLDGKVAIVTGGGRGVGRGEAIDLGAHGAKVVVNDLGGSTTGDGADKSPAEEVASIIRDRGGEAVANYDDISDFNGAKNLVEQAVEAFGGLDIVVNNAGILRDKMLVSMAEEDFDQVIRVHLKGTFCVSHHAASYWRAQSKAGNQPRASIINTVSSAGLQGNLGQTNYGAAKAGIAAMTIIHSLELAQYGVRANAIAPGGMTRMVGTIRQDAPPPKNPEEYETFDGMNPGNSASMVVWLASDQAMHVTGQVFRAVGNTISLYEPWAVGATVESKEKDGSPSKWDPNKIGPAVNAGIFHSRHPGLQMGR
jgi:NAD(P)-dependent dehydrogenase (short-subunit alcohol dehydrogenase family)